MSPVEATDPAIRRQSDSPRLSPTSGDPEPILDNRFDMHVPANRFARVLARLLDSLFVLIVSILLLRYLFLALEALVDFNPRDLDEWKTLAVGILLLNITGVVYELTTITRCGCTLGKAIFGLKVIKSDSREFLSTRQATRRTMKQLLLHLLFPLGLISTYRLLFKRDSSRWYDLGLVVQVAWAVDTGSLRRRPWMWAEQHVHRNELLYMLLLLWTVLVYFVFSLLQPWNMTESQTTDVMSTLVGLNGTMLAAFVGAGALAKHSRAEWLSEDIRNQLAAVVALIGVCSLSIIVGGVAYLASALEDLEPVTRERQLYRIGAVLISTLEPILMLYVWIVRTDIDRAVENSDPGESLQPIDDSKLSSANTRATNIPPVQTTVSNPRPQRCPTKRTCRISTLLAFVGGFVSALILRVHGRRRKKR